MILYRVAMGFASLSFERRPWESKLPGRTFDEDSAPPVQVVRL
jgi:hypothetical protein